MTAPPRRSALRKRFALAFTASLALHVAAVAGVRNGPARAAEPPVAAQRLRLQTAAPTRTPAPTPPSPVPTPAASPIPVPLRRPHVAHVQTPAAVHRGVLLEHVARTPRFRAADGGRGNTDRVVAVQDGSPFPGSGGEPVARGDAAVSASGEASPVPTATVPVAPVCTQPERPARTLTAMQPEEPDEARRLGQTGMVTVRVDLDADGGVRAASVVQTSGSAALDAAARDAARASRYAPELHDCRPIAGSYLFVATFDQ